MSITIEVVSADHLDRYATVSSAFRVESVLEVKTIDAGLGGLALVERAVAEPYAKDYDRYEEPLRWPRFDVTHWRFALAVEAHGPVGAAAVALRSPGFDLLEGRDDLALLLDIRVQPDRRGQGIGTLLFDHAVQYARERGCAQLKVETQNVNVPACRFYAARGCRLAAIHVSAYREPAVRHEAMLVWTLDL